MILFYSFIFIFGLTIGSFLNCLIWRLHTKESMWDRSRCPKCKRQIAWYDNIPVLSFLILGGRCRNCKKNISIQYPIVEFIVGILFVAAVISDLKLAIWNDIGALNLILSYQLLITILRDWFIISVMAIVFIYDLRWYLILDEVVLPACAAVFILNLLLGFSWVGLIIAGVIGCGFFLLQFIVSRGKWIGGGDIRLGLFMGLSLGKIDLLLLSIFLAYMIGSVVGLGLIAMGKKKWGSKVPLGIFLSTATIVSIFWGREILNWYFNILY